MRDVGPLLQKHQPVSLTSFFEFAAGHHETAYGWTPNGVPSLAASPSYSARVSHPAALPLPAYLPQHHHQPGFLSHEVLSGNENVKRWRRGSWAAEGAGPAPRLSTGATSPHLYRQSLAHAPPNPTYSSGHLPVNPPVDHRRLSAAAAQHHFRVAASTTAHRRSSLVHRRPSLLGPPAPTTALHSAHAAEPPSPQTHNVSLNFPALALIEAQYFCVEEGAGKGEMGAEFIVATLNRLVQEGPSIHDQHRPRHLTQPRNRCVESIRTPSR